MAQSGPVLSDIFMSSVLERFFCRRNFLKYIVLRCSDSSRIPTRLGFHVCPLCTQERPSATPGKTDATLMLIARSYHCRTTLNEPPVA
jgi:hypothetical protein